MSKKSPLIFSKALCIALFALPSALTAKELASEQPALEQATLKRCVAGERACSTLEYVQRHEERLIEIQRKQAEGYETPAEAEAAVESIAAPHLASSEESIDSESGLTARGLFTTSHEGAFHNPPVVSAMGDHVWLEDGSCWEVQYKDRKNTLDWFTGDLITVTPNHDWFSSFRYRLNNKETGVSVRVNLKEVVFGNGFYTPRQIVSIDTSNREVCLDDGSIWYVTWWDRGELKRWNKGEFVVIGVNDSWWSGKKNILINVHTLDYVWTNCIYR